MMYEIFAYGTLVDAENREYVTGSASEAVPDTLSKYKKLGLNIIQDNDSCVDGVVFSVDDEGLARLDHYEGVAVGLYRRKQVTLDSGTIALVYQKVNSETAIYINGMVG